MLRTNALASVRNPSLTERSLAPGPRVAPGRRCCRSMGCAPTILFAVNAMIGKTSCAGSRRIHRASGRLGDSPYGLAVAIDFAANLPPGASGGKRHGGACVALDRAPSPHSRPLRLERRARGDVDEPLMPQRPLLLHESLFRWRD